MFCFLEIKSVKSNHQLLQDGKQKLEHEFDFNIVDYFEKKMKKKKIPSSQFMPRHTDCRRLGWCVSLLLDVIGWVRPSGFHQATY